MTLKQAKGTQPGDLVRHAWNPKSKNLGIVLSKTLVIEKHTAKILCQKKDKRYDMQVHWFDAGEVKRCQNWEIMPVKKETA